MEQAADVNRMLAMQIALSGSGCLGKSTSGNVTLQGEFI